MVVFEEHWVPPAINFWDDGEEGNYWSNYLIRYPNATEIDSYIWDTPYNISENNQDNYPLVEPYIIPELPLPEPEPFPTTMVIASIAIISVVGLGFLHFLKRGDLR